MIDLSGEIESAVNIALENRVTCIIATASDDGEPSVGYKGSMMVFSPTSLAYWETAKRLGLKNIQSNPSVVVMYRNPEIRRGWKFFGTAMVHKDGQTRQSVMDRVVPQELDKDTERSGIAVVIEIHRVETMKGEIVMTRDA